MGTRSLTYVYDKSNQIIVKMYLQFDGQPERHGADLAIFLKGYQRRRVSMERLAGALVTKFLQMQPDYAMLISPEEAVYCGEEWIYHIYQNKVVFSRYYDNMTWQADWRSENFSRLCCEFNQPDEQSTNVDDDVTD